MCPSEAADPVENRNAATVTVSSQHVRLDFCIDTFPAAASHSDGQEHRSFLDPVATVSVSELQVIHIYHSSRSMPKQPTSAL